MNSGQGLERWYEYDAWGREAGGEQVNPFNGRDRVRYKGALWFGEQVELYYMRSRWYEPKTGRFLSEDPIGLAGGINAYVFAGNSPLSRGDPLGLQDGLQEGCELTYENGVTLICPDPNSPEERLKRIVDATNPYDASGGAGITSGGVMALPAMTSDTPPGRAACPAGMSFQSPVVGRQTSPFGIRAHPIYGDERLHAGIDIAAPWFTPVRAAAAGTVSYIGPVGGYGNTIKLDHGSRVMTLYAHLAAYWRIFEGQAVAAGDWIGLVGRPGATTGFHVHFELLVNGRPIDPAKCGL